MGSGTGHGLNRRDFIKGSVIGLVGLPTLKYSGKGMGAPTSSAKVALVKTGDRKAGVKEALSLFEYAPVAGKSVLVKPNFNTADPTPGSTHNDTLSEIVKAVHGGGAKQVTVGDRSGPQPTDEVLKVKGIHELAKDLNFDVLNFSDLPAGDWALKNPEGIHWEDGFLIAQPVLDSEYVVSTCCLKTHQYGGVFTMSLKLSVGLVPRKQMRELHGSPDMRKMIAEINLAYQPELVVLDGIEAFVDGGPMEGSKKKADVILAGRDRVAVDAAGLAVLKHLGANKDIMERKIFAQEQIQRATELGLGVSTPEQIDFITPDRSSRQFADELKAILAEG
jgi:uncharacterized protein (DUF362 family)